MQHALHWTCSAIMAAFAPFAPCQSIAESVDRRTENVVLVTIDGLRWQEVFGGAENALFNKEKGGIRDLLASRRRFWRGTPEARRELLMPFFWKTIVGDGQVFGDPTRGAVARVTNGHNFSYPGYAELITGWADPRIDSNAKRPNPSPTVLGWLGQREPWAGRIAAFASWDVFPWILDERESGVPVNAGWERLEVATTDTRLAELNALADALPRYWESVRFDAVTFYGAIEWLRVKQPRVLYLALGETDDWGHDRRYDLYLQMAQRADAFLAELWAELQSTEQYRGKTSLIVTTDHGRGEGQRWTDHGKDVPGSDAVWIAVLGPDTPAMGLRENVETTQAQVAASVAQLLGEEWCAAEPRAAKPLPGITR